MASLLQNIYRNIGSRQTFTWQDGYVYNEVKLGVSVSGTRKASFNATDGYTLSMTLGRTSISPYDGYTATININGSNIASIISQINSQWASFDPFFITNPPALDVGLGNEEALGIVNPYYIKINNTTRKDFEVFGLPIVEKDINATRSDGYVSYSTSVLDALQVISEPMSIPDGANEISIYSATYNYSKDINQAKSPSLVISFSNDVDGYTNNKLITDFAYFGRVDVATYNQEQFLQFDHAVNSAFTFPDSNGLKNLGFSDDFIPTPCKNYMPIVTVGIPAGAKQIRIFFLYIPSQGSTISNVPTYPMGFSAAAYFAAR